MADILDVETALVAIIGAAVYPNGTGQPSAVGATVSVYPGWPNAACLSADLAAGAAHVSIFTMPSSNGNTFQHINEAPGTLVAPVHNVTAAIVGGVVTLTGAPAAGEAVTVIVNRTKSYSRSGANVTAICAALLADLIGDFPGSTAVGGVLTLVGAFEITVRIGANATIVRPVRRVSQQFQISVWAPTPAIRSALGNLATVTLIEAYRFTLPDQSQARTIFSRSDDVDTKENAGLYRRDVVVTVEYALTQAVAAFEVTTVDITADVGAGDFPGVTADLNWDQLKANDGGAPIPTGDQRRSIAS